MTVAIIGGGVVGLYAAAVLAEQGHAVQVLDDRADDRPAGASFVNAGLLVPSHLVPLVGPGVPREVLRARLRRLPSPTVAPRDRAAVRWLALALARCTPANVERGAPVLAQLLVESLARLRADLRRDGREEMIQGQGVIMVARTDRGVADAQHVAGLAVGHGIDAEILDGEDLRRCEPGLTPDAAGGALFPRDAWIDPADLMALLARRASDAGAVLSRGNRADGVRIERGSVRGVECRDGFVSADAVVVAAGAGTAPLLRRAGVYLPLIGGRGYGVTLDVAPARRPRHALILVEDHIAIAPRRAGVHLTGGMAIGARDEGVDQRCLGAMHAALDWALPSLSPSGVVVPAAAGLRPLSPDGLPYVGVIDGIDGLLVSAGHGMLGVSLAAVSAARVAAALAGEAPGSLGPGRLARRLMRRRVPVATR